MSSIKLIIVEDEPLIAEDLAANVEDLGYQVSAIVDNAMDAMAEIAAHKPDLLLLDINLEGDLDGVQLAEKINSKFQIPFIFITSHADEGTIERVKRVAPAGFIVKPFDERDLHSNIEIALFRYANKLEATAVNNGAATTQEEFVIDDSIFVRDKGRLTKVAFDDILYAQAYDNYTHLFTSNGKHLVSSTLKQVEMKLPASKFMRVHRSYMVNVQHVSAMEDGYVFIQKQSIPVGKTHKEELMGRVRTL